MDSESQYEKLKNEWQNNPKYWIGGFLYYNKEDKRIFPPKRISFLGWTINFANPKSILASALLILIILAIGFAINW